MTDEYDAQVSQDPILDSDDMDDNQDDDIDELMEQQNAILIILPT